MKDYDVQKDLNALLKGEQMAVESYEKFINAAGNEAVRNGLRDIQKGHRQNAEELAGRIQDLGGRPDYNTGISGVIVNARLAMETKDMNDSIELLKRAYDGEDRGIAAAEEVMAGGLDEESRRLVVHMLDRDHGHLRTMLFLMSEYGYRQ